MGVLVSVVMQGGNEGINYLSTGQTATGAEIRQKQGEYLSRTQDALVDELVNYGMTESQAVELLSGAMGDVLAQSAPTGEVRAEENAPIASLEPTLAPEATQSPQISSPAPALSPEASSSEPVQIKTPQSATQAATEAENIINTVLELKNSEASAPAENASAAQKAEETVGYMLKELRAETPDAVIHKSVTETISDSVSELSSMSPVAALSGNEFSASEQGALSSRVKKFFAKLGNKVERQGFGEVLLTNQSVKDDIAHGVGRTKATTFAAVPDVIKYGKQISATKNFKERGYDSYIFAAPVSIGNRETVYVGAVVRNVSFFFLFV